MTRAEKEELISRLKVVEENMEKMIFLINEQRSLINQLIVEVADSGEEDTLS